MLTLSLNGHNIPLSLDFSTRLTWKSPVTDFEKIPSGYGLGISFPINQYTKPIFGNAHRFAKFRDGNDQKFPGFEVRFCGVLLMAGTLKITGSSKDNYEATLIDQVGVLGEKEQERSILDIPAFDRQQSWQNSADYHPDTHSYCCFPVINNNFFTDKGMKVKRDVYDQVPGKGLVRTNETYEVEIMSYCFGKSTNYRVNALNGDGTIKTDNVTIDTTGLAYENGRVSVVSPFFFLNHIIKESIKSSNFHIHENYLSDSPVLRKVCIYNSYDITKTKVGATGEILFGYWSLPVDGTFEQTMPDDLNSFGYKTYGYIRSYLETILVDHVPQIGVWMKPKNHLPKIKVGELLLSTQNLFNVVFHFLPNSQVNVFSREEILAGEAIDIDPYFLSSWAIGEKKNVSLKFSRSIEEKDMVFSERFTDLSDRRDDIREPVASWTELESIENPQESEIRFIRDKGVFAEYKWITQTEVDGSTKNELTNDVLGWEECSIGLQDAFFQYGHEETEEIKTSWGTCYGTMQNTLVSQQGSMDIWKSKQQPFAPRLLLYDKENHGANEIPELSLEYEKEGNGILPVLWKNWNRFWANRLPVTGEFDFPVNVLRHMIYNICHKYRTREGEFLIEEMSCELFVDRIGTTEIKGFKVE